MARRRCARLRGIPLTSAADERSEYEALLSQLSTTIDLNGIDLSRSELREVYLPGRALVAARLEDAVLDGAKLYFSDLRHARLRGASLRGADLSGSTLAFADLRGADLSSAILHDDTTSWPDGHEPPSSAPVSQEAIASMDLVQYLAWRETQRRGPGSS